MVSSVRTAAPSAPWQCDGMALALAQASLAPMPRVDGSVQLHSHFVPATRVTMSNELLHSCEGAHGQLAKCVKTFTPSWVESFRKINENDADYLQNNGSCTLQGQSMASASADKPIDGQKSRRFVLKWDKKNAVIMRHRCAQIPREHCYCCAATQLHPCLASKLQAGRHCCVPSAQTWLVMLVWLNKTFEAADKTPGTLPKPKWLAR